VNNILILAYECYPYNRPGSTIGAQRPYHFAKNLPDYGFRAIVLCCDAGLRWSLSCSFDKIELQNKIERALLSKNDVNTIIPLPSLSYNGFWHKQWLSTVIIDDKLGTFRPKKGILVGIRRKFFTLLSSFNGDYSQSWQPVAFQAACYVLSKIRIDFILAEHGPDASIFVARKLNQKFGIRWGVDFRDPLPAAYKKVVRPWIRFYFKRLLRTSSVIFNVNPYWSELDKQQFSKPSFVITNGFDEDEFKDLLATNAFRATNDSMILLYFGSVKPGQSFDVLFEALNKYYNEDNTFPIIFQYYGPSSSKVTFELKKWKVDQYAEVYPQLDRSEVIKRSCQSDFLVLLSKVNDDLYFRKGFYPGKVFEYFALKRLIICVPSDKGMLDDLLTKTRTGISFSDSSSLLQFLKVHVLKKIKGEYFMHESNDLIEEYSRSNQSALLADYLRNFI
jgi:hypothetical protein